MSDLLIYLQEHETQFRKTRLPALYSDFRQLRTTNPDGYAANTSAWIQGLSAAARAGVMPTTSATPDRLLINFNQELLHALETRDGCPLALEAVVREGVARKEMIKLQEYLDAKMSIYHNSWTARPRDFLSWGLRQLRLWGGTEGIGLVNGRVVVLENLEMVGKEAQKRFESCRGRVERVFTRVEFQERFGDVLGPETSLSETDIELLLKFLARDKGLIVYDGETVKLRSPNEPSEITIEDTTIASLKTLIKDLDVQTTLLTKRVDELEVTAKEAVSRKNRVAGLAALRSKKLAENTLTKRHATLAQLQEVFSNIEQAADQFELIKIMEASTRVLTTLNKAVGGVDGVEKVVDRIREQMGHVDEVGNVIAEVGQADVVDEVEVGDELEAIEREEMAKREANERTKKEEHEREEAARTRIKLETLEDAERQAQAAKNKGIEDFNVDEELAQSIEGLTGLSLEPGAD